MKNKLIHIFFVLILFQGNSCSNNQKSAPKHFFSMTCKVDAVLEQFNTQEGRQKALNFFNDMHVKLVYLESYRHGVSVPSSLLQEVKQEFEKEGIKCAAEICPSKMSEIPSTGWIWGTCFSDPKGREFLRETVIRTAKIFDLIIIDDFLFTDCQCNLCKELKNNRSWPKFRKEQMMEVSRSEILDAAKEVNPNCKIIIKYPCWYETLQESGYDVIKQTELFDFTCAGTETREGGPQTQACWYQAWMNDISKGKCIGGWYDPLSSPPEIYVEQARQTILGGAKESLLHSYDYLDTDRPGIALDGDTGVKYGKDDAKALQFEIEGLQFLAEYISDLTPEGVLLAKKPSEDIETDQYLLGKLGLLGIPFIAAGTLNNDHDAYFFTEHSSNFENLNSVIENCISKNIPMGFSQRFFLNMDTIYQKELLLNNELLLSPYLIRTNEGILNFYEDPFKMSENELNKFRNELLVSYNLKMEAPRNVSLHLFSSNQKKAEVIENFNNETVFVKLIFKTRQNRKLILGLPQDNYVKLLQNNENKEYLFQIEPRSLALIGN